MERVDILLVDDESSAKISAAVDNAIEVHASWLARFHAALRGINREKFDQEAICDDTACAFGKWLYSSQGCFVDQKRYEEIKSLHKELHATAGELAKFSLGQDYGNTFKAGLGTLARQSSQLIGMLLGVKESVRQQETR